MLDAIADAAQRLAFGDDARFLTDVARATKAGEPATKAAAAAPRPAPSAAAAPAPRSHPAGERQGKRASALAENIKRWLKGRGQEKS